MQDFNEVSLLAYGKANSREKKLLGVSSINFDKLQITFEGGTNIYHLCSFRLLRNLGCQDKDGQLFFDGDIYIDSVYYDDRYYLRKGYPNKIYGYFIAVFYHGRTFSYLLDIIEDHKHFYEELKGNYNYYHGDGPMSERDNPQYDMEINKFGHLVHKKSNCARIGNIYALPKYQTIFTEKYPKLAKLYFNDDEIKKTEKKTVSNKNKPNIIVIE